MGVMTYAVSVMKTISTPGVMPRPESASHAPTKKTPSWAVTPAREPSAPMRVTSRRLRHLARSTPAFPRAKSAAIAASALKLLMTEKPPRLSRSEDVSAPLRSETVRSAHSTRSPAAREAAMGSAKKAQDMTVSSGLYASIITSAPRARTALEAREKSPSRQPRSTLAASFEKAERYTALSSPEKAAMLFCVRSSKARSLYCRIARSRKRGLA